MAKMFIYLALVMVAQFMFALQMIIRRYWFKRQPPQELEQPEEELDDQDGEMIVPCDCPATGGRSQSPAPRILQPSAIRMMCTWPVEEARTQVFYHNPDFARSSDMITRRNHRDT